MPRDLLAFRVLLKANNPKKCQMSGNRTKNLYLYLLYCEEIQQELLGISFANRKSRGKEMIKLVDTRQTIGSSVLTSKTFRYKSYILTYDDKNLCYNIPHNF